MTRLSLCLAASLMALNLSASSVLATTFNIVGSFSGGQLGDVSFDLTIDADFSSIIFPSTDSGLTINSMTSSVVAGDPFPLTMPLTYAYGVDDRLLIGGGNPQIFPGNTTDFFFLIDDLTSSPAVIQIVDTLASSTDIGRDLSGSVTVTELNPVPLPAGGFLLLTGLLVVAVVRGRKKRAA